MRTRRSTCTPAVVLVAAALALVSCSRVDEIEWKEQVKLHNGAVIEVERRATRGDLLSGLPRSTRGPEYSYEVCYRPMGVYWSSNAPYAPYIFDLVDERPIVVIPLHHCLSCQISGYPETSTMVYQFDSGSWRRIEASKLPKTVNRNLLRMFWDPHDRKGDARGVITLDQKNRKDAGHIVEDLWRWIESKGKMFCEECRKSRTEFVGGKQPTILRDRGDSKFCL